MANKRLVRKILAVKATLAQSEKPIPILGTKKGDKFFEHLCAHLAGLDKAHIVKREVRRLMTNLNVRQNVTKPGNNIGRRCNYRKNRPAASSKATKNPTNL